MKNRAGFTIMELVIATTILAVLLSIAWPAVGRSTSDTRLNGAARLLAADLNRARIEAIKRNARVCVALTADGYAVQFVGRRTLPPDAVIKDAPDTVRFVPFGPLPTGAADYTIVLGGRSATVRVSAAGMVIIQ